MVSTLCTAPLPPLPNLCHATDEKTGDSPESPSWQGPRLEQVFLLLLWSTWSGLASTHIPPATVGTEPGTLLCLANTVPLSYTPAQKYLLLSQQ